jgi:hypothetical protein
MIDEINIAALFTCDDNGEWPSVPPILTRETFVSIHRQLLELASAETDSDRATDLLDAASVLGNSVADDCWSDADLVLLLSQAFAHLIDDLRSGEPSFYGPLPLSKARGWFRHLRLAAQGRPRTDGEATEIR